MQGLSYHHRGGEEALLGATIPEHFAAIAERFAETGPPHSEFLSYTFVELGTTWRDIDEYDEGVRVWDVRASVDVLDTFYVLGSAVGPHPYPLMVRHFQSVIGQEAREQFLDRYGELPDLLVACVGGGSNAAGLFYPFIGDDIPLACELIALDDATRATLYGFRPGLQDVDLAVVTVFAPFDVHRTAIMFFYRQRVPRQFCDIIVADTKLILFFD